MSALFSSVDMGSPPSGYPFGQGPVYTSRPALSSHVRRVRVVLSCSRAGLGHDTQLRQERGRWRHCPVRSSISSVMLRSVVLVTHGMGTPPLSDTRAATVAIATLPSTSTV